VSANTHRIDPTGLHKAIQCLACVVLPVRNLANDCQCVSGLNKMIEHRSEPQVWFALAWQVVEFYGILNKSLQGDASNFLRCERLSGMSASKNIIRIEGRPKNRPFSIPATY
jgi:hypothetical protein